MSFFLDSCQQLLLPNGSLSWAVAHHALAQILTFAPSVVVGIIIFYLGVKGNFRNILSRLALVVAAPFLSYIFLVLQYFAFVLLEWPWLYIGNSEMYGHLTQQHEKCVSDGGSPKIEQFITKGNGEDICRIKCEYKST